MESKITFEQLPNEVGKLREDVRQLKILIEQKQNPQPKNEDDLPIGIKEASKVLNLAVPTIYSKVSKNELPYIKQGKLLYFFKKDLIDYIRSGRAKTRLEIQKEADEFLSNKKKG